ncbi:MAG: PAC2 family protein [Chloroflexi bacterium]|nr:PAC2 family protein [Chloroflexota bacterium]
MNSRLNIFEKPRLKNPSLVVGWADAGQVGVGVVDYLVGKLSTVEFAEIEPYDFSPLPDIFVRGGVLEEIEYPGNRFYYWKNRKSAGDLILFCTDPPSQGHYEFANLILDLAELFSVKRIYTVGGLLANVMHGENPELFAVVNSPRLKRQLRPFELEIGGDYHGPTSMNGLVLGLAKQRKIDGLSLWGRVPSYIGEIPNPSICEAILRVLTQLLTVDIDFSEIETEVRHANKQIEEIVSYIREQNPDLDRHIGKLEQGTPFDSSEEDRKKIIRDIEDFLRRGKGEHK